MKIAIIGCGTIASTHIEVTKLLGAEIVALCDVRAERAEALKTKYDLSAAVYTDYRRMLDEKRPDVVHVCTPHYLHAEMATAALDRGINVLTEKPLCISLEQYEQIRAAEERSSARLGVCFQNRYIATNVELKRRAEKEGAVSAFAAVPWMRDEGYYLSTDWRGRREREGGGVLMNQAIHTLDLVLWFMGEPVSVEGTVQNRHLKGVIDEEDTAELYLRFASGAVATFYATTAMTASFAVSIGLATKEGSYTAVGNDLYTGGGDRIAINEQPDVVAKDYWGKGHLFLVRDFYDCIRTGRPFPITAREAMRSVAIIQQLYASNGHLFRLDLTKLK